MDGTQIRYTGIGRQLTVNLRPLSVVRRFRRPSLVGWLVDRNLMRARQ